MKSGFVAVAGRPNVGKSTLVNALSGGKVAIVSDKPQTTRQRIFGIANGEDHQLVLVDLPGFQRPLDRLTERMQRTVDNAFEEVGAKFVRAVVLVETESQKQILVGKAGAMVKDIGTRARPEVEALLGHPVFLELMVKVRPHWRRNDATLERLGL